MNENKYVFTSAEEATLLRALQYYHTNKHLDNDEHLMVTWLYFWLSNGKLLDKKCVAHQIMTNNEFYELVTRLNNLAKKCDINDDDDEVKE